MFLILFGIIFFIAICIYFYLKYQNLQAKNLELKLYLKKILTVISQIRYGNLAIRLDGDEPPEVLDLTKTINSALDSIVDRENMIQEYIIKEKETANLKTDFVATLTHDLKVPVIAQDKTFDLLLDNKFGELTKEQREALLNMKMSNMDLKFLIEALLETYKLEQAKLELNITYGVNLASIVREIIALVEPIAHAHNKKINYFIKTDEDLTADIDGFLLKRVVQNLILNALSYSENAESVDVFLNSDDKNLKIDVRDYGVGIEKEEIEKIFKKYYSGVSKYMKSGVGLGLYLSNKIVKLHKGKIEVESEVGKGTVFSIILPLKYENSPQD